MVAAVILMGKKSSGAVESEYLTRKSCEERPMVPLVPDAFFSLVTFSLLFGCGFAALGTRGGGFLAQRLGPYLVE
jgi:hypothetical protein